MRRRVARGRGCFLYDVPYVGTPDRILAPCGQSAGRAAAQRVSRRAGLGFSLVRCGQSLAAGHSWFQVLQPLAHGPRPGCLVWRQPCRQRTVRKRGLHRSRAASYPAVAGPGVQSGCLYRRGDRFPDGSAGGGSGGQSPAQQPEPDDPFFGRALGERTRLVCGRAARSVGRTARAAGR